MTGPMVSMLVEIPEDLHEAFQNFLDQNPRWSMERAVCAALSQHLMQNGQKDPVVSRVFLDTTFDLAA